jgi:hypothetical protein
MGAPREAVAQGQGNELPPLRNEQAQEHLVVHSFIIVLCVDKLNDKLLKVSLFLDNYRNGMMETYGPDVSWVRGPFDTQVMYDSTGQKPHRKFAIADGAFDSSKVQMSTIACPSHSQTSSQNEIRLAQEVQELKRQRQQDQQQRQEDRQSMLSAFVQFNQQVAQVIISVAWLLHVCSQIFTIAYLILMFSTVLQSGTDTLTPTSTQFGLHFPYPWIPRC